jgi:hypothetical protein
MGSSVSKLILVLAVTFMLFNFSTCEDNLSGDIGLLEGSISIGPLCPVETDPPSPGCLPTADTYKAYPVGIWTSDGKRKLAQISPVLDGSFSVELVPGQYLIRLEKENSIGGSNLPVEVVITAQEKTILAINIDTGIR